MKQFVSHPVIGEILCEESFWTGKKTIFINGKQLEKIRKNTFKLPGDDTDTRYIFSGSLFYSATLESNGEIAVLSEKPRWYETLLSALTVIFNLVWGNSVALCAIFPIIGGAVGGGVSAAIGCASLFLMKKQSEPWKKVLIGLGMFAASVVACFLLALLLIFMLV